MSLEQEIKLVVEGQDKIDLSSLSWLLALADSDKETHHLINKKKSRIIINDTSYCF